MKLTYVLTGHEQTVGRIARTLSESFDLTVHPRDFDEGETRTPAIYPNGRLTPATRESIIIAMTGSDLAAAAKAKPRRTFAVVAITRDKDDVGAIETANQLAKVCDNVRVVEHVKPSGDPNLFHEAERVATIIARGINARMLTAAADPANADDDLVETQIRATMDSVFATDVENTFATFRRDVELRSVPKYAEIWLTKSGARARTGRLPEVVKALRVSDYHLSRDACAVLDKLTGADENAPGIFDSELARVARTNRGWLVDLSELDVVRVRKTPSTRSLVDVVEYAARRECRVVVVQKARENGRARGVAAAADEELPVYD